MEIQTQTPRKLDWSDLALWAKRASVRGCPRCAGKGRIATNLTCPTCLGDGSLRRDVRPMVTRGKLVRVAGLFRIRDDYDPVWKLANDDDGRAYIVRVGEPDMEDSRLYVAEDEQPAAEPVTAEVLDQEQATSRFGGWAALEMKRLGVSRARADLLERWAKEKGEPAEGKKQTMAEWADAHPEVIIQEMHSHALQVFSNDPGLFRLSDYVVSSSVSGPSLVLVPRGKQASARCPSCGESHHPDSDVRDCGDYQHGKPIGCPADDNCPAVFTTNEKAQEHARERHGGKTAGPAALSQVPGMAGTQPMASGGGNLGSGNMGAGTTTPAAEGAEMVRAWDCPHCGASQPGGQAFREHLKKQHGVVDRD